MALALVSCSDDDFKPGDPSLPTGEKVFVSDDNDTKFIIGFNDEEIEVKLGRQDATEEATIPVRLVSAVPGIFTGAESVTFASGESEVTYTVNVSSDMLPYKEYTFDIIIPEEYTNAYLTDAPSPRITCTVKKEDYAVVANGVFTDNVFYEESWPQDLEYSPMLDLYRLPDLFNVGTNIYFHFAQYPDGTQEFYFTDSEGKKVSKMNTGYVYGQYGMVSLTIHEEYGMGYDENEVPEGYIGEFYFVGEFTLPVYNFGANWETFDILEWLDKPWMKE